MQTISWNVGNTLNFYVIYHIHLFDLQTEVVIFIDFLPLRFISAAWFMFVCPFWFSANCFDRSRKFPYNTFAVEVKNSYSKFRIFPSSHFILSRTNVFSGCIKSINLAPHNKCINVEWYQHSAKNVSIENTMTSKKTKT